MSLFTNPLKTNSLSSDEQRLVKAALRARHASCCASSGYAVGAAAGMWYSPPKGRRQLLIGTGANMETSIYTTSIHAEPCAIHNLRMKHAEKLARDGLDPLEHHTRMHAIAFLAYPLQPTGNEQAGSSCGQCLQTMVDFSVSSLDLVVIAIADPSGDTVYRHKHTQLLPGVFDGFSLYASK